MMNSTTLFADPTYLKCFWTITKNSTLYVLVNKGSPTENLGYVYYKLGKVISCNYSKVFQNDEGSKKTVFRLTVEKEVLADEPTAQSLNESFGGEIEKDMFAVQEHMWTDFNANTPAQAKGLAYHPISSPSLLAVGVQNNFQKKENWLKSTLQKMVGPSAADLTQTISFFTELEAPKTPAKSSSSSQSSSSSGGAANVFGGQSANTGYPDDKDNVSEFSTPGRQKEFDSLFVSADQLASQGSVLFMFCIISCL
jgi:hypothetical protein